MPSPDCERPSREMRHQHGRNANVEIQHLPFGKPGGGIENLLKIRELKPAALHFDDGRRGHGTGLGRRLV